MLSLHLQEVATGEVMLNDQGSYFLQFVLTAGVPVSYYLLQRQLPILLAGDAETAFTRDADGHEEHVDRSVA